jgi:type II secretory pathway pseudopilin PulG
VYHVLTGGRLSSRHAFTLAELLVTFTLLGILGVMFTRILLSQSRFADQQNALTGARMISRQAMNILESELRMVQDSGGIDSVSADGKTIRLLVPYRFGLTCGAVSGRTVVSMLPVDSMSLAQANYAGFAWRGNDGIYRTVLPAAPQGADAPVSVLNDPQCTGNGPTDAQIRTISLSGRSGETLQLSPEQPAAPKGQAVFMFQRITYTFKASAAYPGRFGLYRTVQGRTEDELMAPFDSSARFKYWTRTATASISAPPALGLIRGIDVVFAGTSGYVPVGRSTPTRSTVVASIFFKNVR